MDFACSSTFFYECEGFTLASMTDRYRDEFEKNADWLKMSFHSRLENVRPYEHSGYEEVYADCKAVEDEILRFAGEKTLAKTTTVHYCLLTEGGYMTEGGVRNTTHAFDREGNLVGRYFKEHPAPSEVKTEKEGGHECDVAYSYEFRAPIVITIEGIRFAFLTCYDFYFYEYFAQIARQNVDVIIGCSLQRTDTHEALAEILMKELKHGVTEIKVHGMYSDTDRHMLVCIINKRQIGQMMKIIKSRPGTFASFSKINEVFGNFKRKV